MNSPSRRRLTAWLSVVLALGMASCHRRQYQSLPDVTKPAKVRLSKKPGQGGIHALEVRARGEIDGKATLKLLYPGEPPRTFPLGGKFSQSVTAGDWYDDSIELEYEPSGVTRGNVTFEYDFSD